MLPLSDDACLSRAYPLRQQRRRWAKQTSWRRSVVEVTLPLRIAWGDTVSALLEPGLAGMFRLEHPASLEGYDAVLLYR